MINRLVGTQLLSSNNPTEQITHSKNIDMIPIIVANCIKIK